MQLVAGIDAGGTQVRLLLAEAAIGRPTGETMVLPARPDGFAPEALREFLSPNQALAVVSVCAGITKYTRDGVADSWRTALSSLFPAAQVAVVPDFEIAFRAAVPEGDGVVVIAGTGSVAYGESKAAGAGVRVGGRGYEWGDEGSGAWLTAEMIRRTLRSLDGLSEPTPLTRAVCEFFGADEPVALAALARERTASGSEGRGLLLPLLAERARDGDTEARDFFVGAGGWLALLASTTARRLAIPPEAVLTVATVGGTFKAGGEWMDAAFRLALRRRYPEARVSFSEEEPVRGAVRIARQGVS